MSETEDFKETIEETEKLVAEIENYKADYFLHHKGQTAADRDLAVKAQYDELLEAKIFQSIESCQWSKQEKITIMRIRAEVMMNRSPEYDPDVHETISTFAKKFPDPDILNLLGLSYLRNKEFSDAKNCFELSIKLSKNTDAHQHLSALLRHMPDQPSDYLQQSIDHAKEAVKLTVTDGSAWFSLGMAFLTSYFEGDLTKTILTQSLKCFANAFKSGKTRKDPFFLHIRAIALFLSQNFLEGMTCLDLAHDYLPTWGAPVKLLKDLEHLFEHLADCDKMKDQLTPHQRKLMLKKYNMKLCGKYYNKPVTVEGSEKPKILSLKKLSRLHDGHHPDRIILGVVVAPPYVIDTVSYAFWIVDQYDTCVAVNVNNVAKGKTIAVGDFVAVPRPNYESFSFTYKEKNYSFKWIQVGSPLALVINGKDVPNNWFALPTMQSKLTVV